MIKRIAKSINLAIHVAVISYKSNKSIDDILGYTDELTKLPNLKAFERDRKTINEEYAFVLIELPVL